jgi:hypothetical protein
VKSALFMFARPVLARSLGKESVRALAPLVNAVKVFVLCFSA